jgi:hypothetical protein
MCVNYRPSIAPSAIGVVGITDCRVSACGLFDRRSADQFGLPFSGKEVGNLGADQLRHDAGRNVLEEIFGSGSDDALAPGG